MGYTQVALEDKLLDMYPEIKDKNISPHISFDEEKNAWIVKLIKDNKEKTVCLEKEDADACIENKYCETFGSDLKNALAELS
jgi:hypothetical protein